MTGQVVVVGGGLAGLAAAVRLAGNGCRVTVLEGRSRLGGATHSFRRGGLDVDNGQHVFLRCYTAYRDFLARISASPLVKLQDRFEIPVVVAGRHARLRRSRWLPAPLHLTTSMAGYPGLTPRERLRAGVALARLRRLSQHDPELDDTSFGSWLRAHGQSAGAIESLWDLLVVAALNARCDDASLLSATQVFQRALLTTAGAADIGLPLVPLDRLHAEPARHTLSGLGAKVHLRARVQGIRWHEGSWRVHLREGVLPADAVVVAVPHDQALRVLPEGALAQPDAVARLGHTPIINAHFVLDRVVGAPTFVAAVGSPLQWVFDRTAIAGAGDDRQYLAASLSAAESVVDLDTATLRATLVPALHALFPASRTAGLLDFFVTRERRATFCQRPGSRQGRAATVTGRPGLLLAGAWTDTGWPDTMEGAVRSGYEAAEAALRVLAARVDAAVVR
ncbi:hydroxysqualene dehydroxylase HpnE [Lentzea sp. E54]|uniref:hydroxysqualene dehydroxylase HpnE n=1 Tax=Lentzea xerophila TaxID=3435883 RepID=UPI003DA5CCC3